MSWFDGIIPDCCRNCFSFQQGKWQMHDHIECDDSCDCYLFLFPVLTQDHKLDHSKLALLYLAREDPVWRTDA